MCLPIDRIFLERHKQDFCMAYYAPRRTAWTLASVRFCSKLPIRSEPIRFTEIRSGRSGHKVLWFSSVRPIVQYSHSTSWISFVLFVVVVRFPFVRSNSSIELLWFPRIRGLRSNGMRRWLHPLYVRGLLRDGHFQWRPFNSMQPFSRNFSLVEGLVERDELVINYIYSRFHEYFWKFQFSLSRKYFVNILIHRPIEKKIFESRNETLKKRLFIKCFLKIGVIFAYKLQSLFENRKDLNNVNRNSENDKLQLEE